MARPSPCWTCNRRHVHQLARVQVFAHRKVHVLVRTASQARLVRLVLLATSARTAKRVLLVAQSATRVSPGAGSAWKWRFPTHPNLAIVSTDSVALTGSAAATPVGQLQTMERLVRSARTDFSCLPLATAKVRPFSHRCGSSLTFLLACQLGCTKCADITGACLTCKSGFTQDGNDKTKCNAPQSTTPDGTVCPDGSFSDGSKCQACSPSCQTCTAGTSNDCILCKSGTYAFNGGCVSADQDGVCEGTQLIADNNKKECDSTFFDLQFNELVTNILLCSLRRQMHILQDLRVQCCFDRRPTAMHSMYSWIVPFGWQVR